MSCFVEERVHSSSSSYLNDFCRKKASKVRIGARWRVFKNFISLLDVSLKSPAREEDIQELEDLIGHDLPLELRSSFLIHNGQYENSQPFFFKRLFSIQEIQLVFCLGRYLYDFRALDGRLFCPVSEDIGVDVYTGKVYSNVRQYGFPMYKCKGWLEYLTVY